MWNYFTFSLQKGSNLPIMLTQKALNQPKSTCVHVPFFNPVINEMQFLCTTTYEIFMTGTFFIQSMNHLLWYPHLLRKTQFSSKPISICLLKKVTLTVALSVRSHQHQTGSILASKTSIRRTTHYQVKQQQVLSLAPTYGCCVSIC